MPVLHVVCNQPEGPGVKNPTWGKGRLHHLGDFADRAALDVLNSTASKALTERAKQLRTWADSAPPTRTGSRPTAASAGSTFSGTRLRPGMSGRFREA